jgi:DnaK suppressor protein
MATKPKAKPETILKAASPPASKTGPKDAPKTTPATPMKVNKAEVKTKIAPKTSGKPEPKVPLKSVAKAVSRPEPKPASKIVKPTAEAKVEIKPKVETKAKPEPAPKAASGASSKPVQKPAPKAGVKSAAKAAPSIDPKIQKWHEIRVILEKIKEDALREINKSIKNGTDAVATNEPGGDIYDQASSERDRELGLLLGDREREKLHSIDEALLRIDEDEYGICEECDEDIPIGRLKAMPFTRHCVKCKSDLEKLQAQTKRFEEDRAYREIPLGSEEEEA